MDSKGSGLYESFSQRDCSEKVIPKCIVWPPPTALGDQRKRAMCAVYRGATCLWYPTIDHHMLVGDLRDSTAADAAIATITAVVVAVGS